MKIALMLVGNYRTWDLTKESFIKTFGDTDTFISTYDLRYGYHPNGWGVTDLNDELISEQSWLDSLSGVNVKLTNIERFSDVDNIIKNELTRVKLDIPQNAHQSYGQYRKFKIATDMVQHYEKENNFKYDIIIRSRFDLVYNDEPINFSFEDNEVAYHHGTSPPGEFLGDQFFFTKRDNMINISEFIFNEFFNPVFEDSHLHPPHGILRNALKHNNLTKVNRDAIKHLKRKNGVELIL
jgi:hypothetical protein